MEKRLGTLYLMRKKTSDIRYNCNSVRVQKFFNDNNQALTIKVIAGQTVHLHIA